MCTISFSSRIIEQGEARQRHRKWRCQNLYTLEIDIRAFVLHQVQKNTEHLQYGTIRCITPPLQNLTPNGLGYIFPCV